MSDLTMQEQQIITVAEASRANQTWNKDKFTQPVTTLDEAFNYLTQYHHATPEEKEYSFFDVVRSVVRQSALGKIIVDNTPAAIGLTFDGYGDSGNHHYNAEYALDIKYFLSEAMEKFVTFDWYNNDGGGGDLTWNLADDKIIINGYTNYTETHPEMSEEEF